MHLLEAGDALALLVREHDLEAVATCVAEGELRPGVGALAAADGPRAGRPVREVEGQLGHPGALALAAFAVEGRDPVTLGEGEYRRAHAFSEVEAHGEAEPPGEHCSEKVVGGARRVAAHEGAAAGGALRQLSEGRLKHCDVVGGGARTGVTGAQDPRERLTGRGLAAEQRVEAEAAFVGAGRTFLLSSAR